MKWIPGYKTELLPPDDRYEDFQKVYVCRFKGDDPRSGWVDIKLYSAYVMREIHYSDYWEWLDENEQELLAALKLAHEELRGCYISTDKFKTIEEAIKKHSP